VRTKRAMNFNVSAAVKGALHRLNLDTKMRGYAVWGVWDQAVGETVAQQAQPTFVRAGTLFVKCSSSAWMQELQFMKGTICKELNRLVGREAVKDIRFQMGTIARPSHNEPSAADQEVALDDAERERIDKALRPLQDPETREIVRRIMVKGASANRKGKRKVS
jgi:predicted nucleic acid-binding Zn ribbon protein